MNPIDQQNLPDEFRSLIGLGAPERVFPVAKKHRAGALGAAILLTGGGGLTVLYAFVHAFLTSQRYGPAVFTRTLTGPLLLGLALGAAGLGAAWTAYTNWKRTAVVYRDGLAVLDRKGLRVWRWEQVTAFYRAVVRHYVNGIYAGTTRTYTLVMKDGSREKLNGRYQQIEQLGQLLQEKTFPHLYERAVQTLKAGQPLTFGGVTISPAGLRIGAKDYPWQAIEKVSVQNGRLKVKKKGGGWFSGAAVDLSLTPNASVLLALIKQILAPGG